MAQTTSMLAGHVFPGVPFAKTAPNGITPTPETVVFDASTHLQLGSPEFIKMLVAANTTPSTANNTDIGTGTGTGTGTGNGGSAPTDIAVPRPRGGSGRAFAFADVLSLEPSYLLGGGGQPGAGLARPCLALMLLLPASAAYERRRKATVARIRRSGQPAVSPRLCFLRQTVGGACGTIAVAHAALNAPGVLLSGEVAPAHAGGGSPLLAFARTTVRRRRRRRRRRRGAQGEGEGGDNNAHVTPAPSLAARSERFAADAAIRACHEACTGTPPSRDGTGATAGAAAAAAPSSSVQQQQPLSAAALARREGHHFVTLVAVDGVLYELDGRCPFPINCGACGGGGGASRSKQDAFLLKAAAHVKGMVESEGDASALNWALVALVETTTE